MAATERRSEIGLRRALGASRRHVAEQFLAEAVVLSVIGGVAGTLVGALATLVVALSQHEGVEIPNYAYYGGIEAAIAIGARPLPLHPRRPTLTHPSPPHRMSP